ncbi:MAG: peptidoglycan-binding protein, partial [Azoarcus sp.]|nr:peptidoglycan-binding protein [Azoarcus sp.]
MSHSLAENAGRKIEAPCGRVHPAHGKSSKERIMNLVKYLTVSVCGALLLCSCETVPPQLRALTCKNLPAGEESYRAIQQALADRGYDPGPPDGQRGPRTREALRQFQSSESLPVTGTTDVKTLEALGFCAETASAAPAAKPATPVTPAAATSSTAAPPPTGDPRIQEAQQLLTGQGYTPGPVDGLMGNRTREALRRFQKDKGLSVSGKVDARTLEALRASAQPEWENTPPVSDPPADTLPVSPPPAIPASTLPPAIPASTPPSGIAPPPSVSQSAGTALPAPAIAPPPPVSPAPAPSSGNGLALPPVTG